MKKVKLKKNVSKYRGVPKLLAFPGVFIPLMLPFREQSQLFLNSLFQHKSKALLLEFAGRNQFK